MFFLEYINDLCCYLCIYHTLCILTHVLYCVISAEGSLLYVVNCFFRFLLQVHILVL
jgi:hypothetical protein